MKKLVFYLAFAVLFLITNRWAYKGYFDGDDLDNLVMTNAIGFDVFVDTFFSPKLDQSNFRPVGHSFYRFFGRRVELDYPRYIAFIQTIHLLNVLLLWLVLRALAFDPLSAAFGVLLFGFHMGTFEIYSKPMYIFDLLCATFSLSSILLWIHNRWILSFLAFWCAFKSKEVAIALPAVLAVIEWNLGKMRWARLLPFFAVSFSFGLQAMLANRARDNDYTLRFTGRALAACLKFYGNKILIVPYGALLVAALVFVRDRWARAGVAILILLMGPMFFLPGRLFGAYLYVPLIGLAIAAAAFSRRAGWIATAVATMIWIPLNFREMQQRRKDFLAISDETRAYVNRVHGIVADNPATNAFIFDKSPEGLHYWGVRAAVKYMIHPEPKTAEIRTPDAARLVSEPNLVYLIWDPQTHRLNTMARSNTTPDIPYLTMNETTPLWQLGEGWHGIEGKFQWTNLTAQARIARPPDATRFEVVVNVGSLLIDTLKRIKLEVFIDGVKIGEREFTTPGWSTASFDAPPSTSATAQVQFKASPGYFYQDHDPADALGIGIGAFGFPTAQFPSMKLTAGTP